ncbi:MAG TPA: precorrin-3B C(17)-methyltransferase [Candidatus Tenderia electrophaga]|uniref:Precorrin-3B C(17)-methyltransferase n=1 Tax=Candidatus Tenderia electrophaga TaxID=1748243 RepID=A0A832N3H3_9GAMM|nr:precorrin-3B C(17)-methyltransferase [Candidatus Tenderia electrophaga]
MNKGKIFLVGFGPGAKQHMSARAVEAIKESDVVIGYSTYIKLVQDQLEGKEVVRKGMTEELDRSIEAYEQARQGKTVALISSGDIGVYGMAGPTYEVLLKSGWTPNSDIEVEIVPGSTALSACASLVGAPLTHDFCSISLSDLLTPWPVIARRLEAAAKSDFVVALYNPKSGRRTGQIVEAQRILLQHRKPDTPVAIVKSAYRDKQDIRIVRLDEMVDCKIGMLTTVLIGNTSTFLEHGLMITPRGYANKYDQLTGEVNSGEQRGRSLSMGLEGWQGCVREYMRENPGESLPKIVRYFDMPLAQIIAAIAAADADDQAAEFKAVAVNTDLLELVQAQATGWGDLRAVVRNDAGAITEVMLNADNFKLRGEWLNMENDHFHLHIHWAKVAGAWLVQKGDSLRSVHFVDAGGNAVFNLSLRKLAAEFDVAAETCYQEFFQQQAEGVL